MRKYIYISLIILSLCLITGCDKKKEEEEKKENVLLSHLFIEIPNSDVAGYEMKPGENDLILVENGNSFKLNILYTPENVKDKKLEWNISDQKIISVDNIGNVKTLSEGEVTLSAKSGNIESNEITIKVISNNNNGE